MIALLNMFALSPPRTVLRTTVQPREESVCNVSVDDTKVDSQEPPMYSAVKSSQHDGMASLYYLVATHEHAGYEEKARLRTTLHHTASLFVSGNPQSKIPGIRVVLDKAMSLKVKIDYDATVKPTVMVLRKRSPNFNDLATKYLSTDSVKYMNDQWETKSLSIFDTAPQCLIQAARLR